MWSVKVKSLGLWLECNLVYSSSQIKVEEHKSEETARSFRDTQEDVNREF